jgi:hypothetical protein
MKCRAYIAVVLAAGALTATGCQSGGPFLFDRTNVAALQDTERVYYAKLGDTLRAQREEFKEGLTAQLAADQSRRRKMLEWERNLAKAEVLLQVPGKADEKQELLLLKLAEMDLAAGADYHKLDDIDHERLDAILRLYDQVIEASKALLKNDAAIAGYLKSPNATFAAESVDVPAIVRIASAVRTLDDQLKGLAARSDEQRKKDDAKLQKQLEQAQGIIVKALTKLPPTTPPAGE